MKLAKEFEKETGEESHMAIREMYRPKAKYVDWLEYQILKLRKAINTPPNQEVADSQACNCRRVKHCIWKKDHPCNDQCRRYAASY